MSENKWILFIGTVASSFSINFSILGVSFWESTECSGIPHPWSVGTYRIHWTWHYYIEKCFRWQLSAEATHRLQLWLSASSSSDYFCELPPMRAWTREMLLAWSRSRTSLLHSQEIKRCPDQGSSSTGRTSRLLAKACRRYDASLKRN